MREILFRGKVARDCVGVSTQRKYKKGTWVFGDLSHTNYDPPLIDQNNDDPVPVDPTTVGQYTGLTDKNGKRIFEGDVIKTHYANVTKADFVEEVIFHNGRFCAMYQKDGGKMWCPLADGVPHHPGDRTAYMEWCERIGTVHDNPELLEGGNGDAG